jgi:hypothetical protein
MAISDGFSAFWKVEMSKKPAIWPDCTLQNFNVEIVYHPTTKPHDEQTLIMNVAGGTSKVIKLIGDIGMAKTTVNFGLMTIGIAKSQSLRLKNAGEDDAIFAVTVVNPTELQISPMAGRVPAHEFVNLQVQYKLGQPHHFDTVATVAICGAPSLSFKVTGQCELPQVHLQKSEFDFERVFVGSSAGIEIR